MTVIFCGGNKCQVKLHVVSKVKLCVELILTRITVWQKLVHPACVQPQ